MKIQSIFSSTFIFLFIFIAQNSFTFKDNLIRNNQQVLAQESDLKIVNQGQEIIINNKTYKLPWIQWQEGNNLHIGVSDIALESVLGVELLSTNNYKIQPIRWFNYYQKLPTKFINPYRYLDITEFAKLTNIELNINNEKLAINLEKSQIKKAYDLSEPDGKKIVIELNRPSFWQFSKGKEQGILTIEGDATPELITEFMPVQSIGNLITEEEGDEKKPQDNTEKKESLFTVETENNRTIFKINIPPNNNIKVHSANPNLLLVDLQPNAMIEREISWSKDIFLQQKYIPISSQDLAGKNDLFFITYLTINLQKSNLELKPITTNSNSMIGTDSIINMAENAEAITAINGGFFNRKNMLPLGAIRDQNEWLSSPILNRGVIAWDNLNNFKIDRLKLEESITTPNGDRLIINYLNSGYIEPGMARYNSTWGETYTTLTDKEIIILVEEDKIKNQLILDKAGQDTINIPKKGYLLVIRNKPELINRLPLEIKLTLNSSSIPAELANYPNIMGAGPVLLLNGNIVLDAQSEKFSPAFNKQSASRSAIGLTRDQKLLFVTVHSKIGGNGATLLELANIMQYLGATNALNLDGGSSTQLYLGGKLIDRSPATASKVHNGIGIFWRK